MRRDQLILELSRRLGIPKHSAQVFLHSFFDSAKAALRTGDPLRLGSIGTWTPTIHADGTLQSVTYAPAAEALVEERVLPAGPHSSIDTIHFIPAEALDPDTSNPAAAMIDVAALVEEVQSQFRATNGSGNGEDSAAPPSKVPPDLEIPHAPEMILEDGLLADEELDAYEEERIADDDTVIAGEYASLAEDIVSDDEADALSEDTVVDDELASFEHDTYADAAVIDSELAELAEERDIRVDDEENAEREAADNEAEDNEVFYKNRDQLYNPPEERSSRPLMMIALVLTVVVVTILLFILFGEEKRPAVPGHSTGHGLHLESPTSAGAPFPYFE